MIGLGSDKNRARWVFVYLYSADTPPEIRTGKILSKSEQAKQKPVLTKWLSKKKALLLLNRKVHTLPAYCSQSPWRSHILPLLLEHVATVREPRRVRTTATFCEKMQRLRDKAELLLEIDDIVVTLTVDIRMGFKRKKLSNVELADMDEDTRVHIKEILNGLMSNRDFNKVVDQLLQLLVQDRIQLEDGRLRVATAGTVQ